jgi:hypothetical protein
MIASVMKTTSERQLFGPFGPRSRVESTVAASRNPKPRKNDLMIAATAVANSLPLYTANVDDFKGLESMLEVVEVRRA